MDRFAPGTRIEDGAGVLHARVVREARPNVHPQRNPADLVAMVRKLPQFNAMDRGASLIGCLKSPDRSQLLRRTDCPEAIRGRNPGTAQPRQGLALARPRCLDGLFRALLISYIRLVYEDYIWFHK